MISYTSLHSRKQEHISEAKMASMLDSHHVLPLLVNNLGARRPCLSYKSKVMYRGKTKVTLDVTSECSIIAQNCETLKDARCIIYVKLVTNHIRL